MSLEVESTENKGGAPEGNQNAKKGKMFYDQLRMVLVQNDRLKLRNITDKLVKAAEDGEAWAIKEVIDRMDGKPVQQAEIGGIDGEKLVTHIGFSFVDVERNQEG
jgi:hypothetical protein